jgi:amidase
LSTIPEPGGAAPPLHWWTARALAGAMRRRELSAREVVGWHLDRIAEVNPRLNAIVSLRPEAALDEADAADRRAAAGEPLGPLHGLPIAIKDLEDTAGIRTTYGSVAFSEHVPVADSLLVARLRAAGAIVVGKTNTPEFGVGSHTFNQVFGATRNPWALDRTPGGSSGGAGAALAAGLLPIADGSDHGGSIRNPASFNNVVGLRPTPGLVPDSGAGDVWDTASVVGPMARTVGDLALMLTAICGPDPFSPLSHGDPAWFAGELSSDLAGLRVAWCPDVGGLPIEPEVLAVLEQARGRLAALGCHVEDVELNLSRADEAFETLRALAFARGFGPSLGALRGIAKDTLIWNIEQEYPTEVAGVAMPHYLGWMRACSRITVSAHPVAAVPAGFTPDGLPVGLQLVGRYRGDRRLLEHAAAWEAASGLTRRHPPWLDRAAGADRR